MEAILGIGDINAFSFQLAQNESSLKTIEKYSRDVKAFFSWLPEEKRISKELVVTYKREIMSKYAVSSVNSMLAAINHFLRFIGHPEYMVKTVKMQKQLFCAKERELSREEYFRLLHTASQKKNDQLNLIMQTICSTGIRISELEHITVQAVMRGRAIVSGKGKQRTVLLPGELVKKLTAYFRASGIENGPVFVTTRGNAVNRSNVWRAMKQLCEAADVDASKVFPHNLRHLFARQFYSIEKDIARLADILGHSSIETTRIYMASTGNEHLKKLERLRLVI